MPFSITFGVCLMFSTMLLIFAEEENLPCYSPTPRSGHRSPTCCVTASEGQISQPIVSCYEQKANTFPNCQIHAFLFITQDNQQWCISPEAKWLKTRFKRLKNNGICCTVS